MIMKLQTGITPGTYQGRLIRIEEMESRFGPCLKFVYSTVSGDCSELLNSRYTKKSKLGQRVYDLLQEMPSELDINALIGIPVILELVQKPDSEFCKVESVRYNDSVTEGDIPF